MKAITVTYHGPTDTRGSRLVATDHDGARVSVPYDYSLSRAHVYWPAAEKLCRKLGWKGTLIAGEQKAGVQVFVWEDRESTFTVS